MAYAPNRLFNENNNVSIRPIITTIDCHCGGLPARIAIDGIPDIPGDSAFEKRKFIMENMDWIRTLLITEPRGYPCQNLNIILPKTKACPEAEFSYVICENNFVYPAMSGHNTICVATALLESGMVRMVEPVTKFILEAPAGPINITAECKNGKCDSVTFENTASFAREEDLNLKIHVPSIGEVSVDVAYGGMWYAIINAEDFNISIAPENAGELCRIGEMVKVATREQHPVKHPIIDYEGCDIIAIRGKASKISASKYGAHASNAVIMSTGKLDWNNPSTWTGNIDRSPCGSGTSAIMAAMYAKENLKVGEPFVHAGILDTVFTGEIIREIKICDDKIKAIIPTIKGQAWVTQYSKIVVDPTDPFPAGYTLGDIWAC